MKMFPLQFSLYSIWLKENGRGIKGKKEEQEDDEEEW